MSGDIDKINEIFRIHDQQTKSEEPAPAQPEKQGKTDRKSGRGKSSPVKAVDDLFTDKTGEEKEVALRDVAEVGEYTTPSTITRLEQRRYLDVKAGVDENYNITKVTDAAEKALESVELPE